MKKNKKLAALLLALAACAAAPARAADIYEIRAIDYGGMLYNKDRHPSEPDQVCSASHPLVVGDRVYIRVRMAVRNAADCRMPGFVPQTWSFKKGSVSGGLPKLGIFIGDKAAYATYDADITAANADTIDDDALDIGCNWYNDFYFAYDVQPGDLGLPVVLMDSDKKRYSVDDNTKAYYLLNCGENLSESVWVLSDTGGNPAEFRYGPTSWGIEPPETISGDDSRWISYSLEREGIYVKTVDFDADYASGDVWRYVYAGRNTPVDVLLEPMVVIPNGGVAAADTTVWVFSEDESIVAPDGATQSITYIDENGVEQTRNALPVTINAGAGSATFKLRGADSAAEGAWTNICLSATRTPTYNPAGTDTEQAAIVRRKVMVRIPPPPTVSMRLDGKMEVECTADPDYETAKVLMTFTIDQAVSAPVTLDLAATYANGGGSISGMYDYNFIRICDTETFNDTKGRTVPTQATIPAGETSVTKYVYILGASNYGEASDTEDGIEFLPSIASAPADVRLAADGPCTLYIYRGGDMNPVAVIGKNPDVSIVNKDPGNWQFKIKVLDTYRSMNAKINSADYSGYTLYVEDADDGTTLLEVAGKRPDKNGWLTLSLPVDKSLDGKDIVIYALSPDGETYTDYVYYTLDVNDAQQVTVAPQEEGVVFVGESDTEMFPLTLSINKAPNEVKYIFLKGATAADDQLFTSPQKTTGAAVGPTASQLSAPGAATFSDGRSGGTPVTMNAFLSDSQTDPTQVITAWTPGTLTVTVTNKPPEFLSLTFNGDPLTPADNGKTLDDPVSLNVENSFVLSVKDVAADLGATGADAFKVKWVFDNGTPEEKEGDPNGVEVKHAFTAAKTASVSVWLKDKDMPNYPTEAAFTFYVKVREKPAVTITTGADATGGTFLETDANKDNAWVKVELEEKPTEAITVRFTVGQTTDGGFLKLRTVAGSVEQAVDGGGNPIPGAYDIAFAAGQAVKQVVINDMDGSVDSAAGLALNASVITESLNPYGIRWCDYYAIADEVEVKVQNVEPVLNSVTFDGQYIKVSEGAPALDPIVIGVPKKLSLSATDVDADINATEDGKKFQVKWSIDGVVQEKEGNPEGVEVTHTFTGPSGRNAEVRVWLKDKDMTGYPTDPAFTFQVPLKDRPFVAIAPSVGDSGTLDENASGAYFDLTLSESAAEEIKVRFTVGQTTDGGFLKLRTVAGSVEQAVDDLGNEIPGAYDITFVAGQTQRRPMVASMDGTADTAGGLVFNASVITDTVNPQGVKWSDYYAAANPVTVYVQNVEPVMVSLSFNGDYFTPADYGTTSSVAVARGVAKTFSVTAGDVDADLNAAAPKEFKIKWEIDGATYYGATVSHTFTAEKEAAVVRVFMKDKDSTLGADEWGLPKFMFKVPVKDRPKVEITLGNDGTYVETDDSSDQAYVAVELSEPATVEITARLTVAQADDGGFMKLRTQSGSVEQAVDGEGNPIPGAYDLTFAIGETRKVVWVARDGFDGTADTRAGLDVNAWVTTTSEYAPGIPWSDYYTPAGVKVARVVNVPPEIVRPTEEEAAYTNENASANTPYSIYYGCTDVKADLEAGVVAEINVDGLTSLAPTPVTDASVREHRVEFSGPGTHFVEVKFTDKDNMTSRRTIYFFVQPSKNIDLRAHGPASAVASDSGDSMRYKAAGGLGAGRVYAGKYGPQQVRRFVHAYSVSREETTIDAVAFGYKADGRADDGTLGGDDVGIDRNGNWTKGTPITEYYNYSTDTEYAECGALGFDSFPYAWACNNVSADTSGDSKRLLFNIGTKSGVAAEMAIPLPTTSLTSEGAGSNIPTYPKQYWEAVFSRELFTADNCGDINQDGIPDIVVFSFGMGIFAEGNLASDVGSEKDLKRLGDYNGDLDKDENESPDFLPAEKTSIYGSLIPGLSGTWVTEGDEFTARLEIRGYDDGLNGALDKPSDGRSSTYWPTSFGIKSDRIYAEEVDGKWQWTENCTISKVEWYAWTEYAAANGLDPDNSDNWSKWSPERPTSPIKSDTDGDGFDDGYEYFFWYRAYVGWLETDSRGNNVHKRLTGRRFNVKNPGEGELISSETIADLMDPLVKAGASAKTRDTDNDGLPDLLEFMIGTNPFDFDTDGDGLPDGWELMVAGLNPLLPVTSADGMADGERNYDGDAMAITSYVLEQAENPAPWNPETCQYTTFAVIKEGGDTDGVQWYAMQNPEMIEIKTNDVENGMWHFKLKDGTDVVTMDTKPTVTADGRLAVDLSRSETFRATVTWKDETDNTDPENPVTTKVIDAIIRGWPVYIPAGTPVDVASIGDEKSDKAKVVVVKKGLTNPKSELPFINSAWIYGKGDADASVGEYSATAREYGCLAIGRNLALEKDLVFCAEPTTNRDVAILHYQVYQKCGFDPRTAWRAENPLSARWSKLVNGEAVEGRAAAASGGYCAFPARTREYRTYDEFLVHSFFVNNGCDMSGAPISLSASVPQTVRDWYVFTTNPQGPNEPDRIQLDASEEQSAVGWSQYFFGRDDADNGADTDGDGVPDGWELYVMSGPGRIGGGGGSPYVSPLSPFVPDAKKNSTLVDGTNETLNEFMEFEGTDSIAHYAEARSDDNPPYSTTIKHDGEWKWFNKFFPTDPWSVDTDEDLINDDKEGDDFAYGTPADNGLLRCIPGGGLNPCSIDTDGDGLPDPWEKQFKGTTVFPGSLPDAIAKLGNKAKDSSDNDIGNYLQGLIDGMDGTVWDALNSPFTAPAASDGVATHVVLNVNGAGANQVVDRDYDHDGLENWQEYMTGTMRCWRYDDPISPWKPIPANLYFRADANGNLVRDEETGELVFEPNLRALNRIYHTYDPFAEATPVIEDMGKFWYLTLEDESSRMYNPALVTDLDNPRGGIAAGTTYFEPLKNVWDPCYVDVTLDTDRNAAYYWLYKNSRTGWWSWQQSISGEPKKYACCSPIDPDSDHDGMDDYYELFHGMNPLLGMSGVRLDSGGPCDLVHDSWGNGAEVSAMSALNNHWYNSSRSKEVNGEFDFYDDIWPGAKPRGNGYDFELYPWLNGMADADPDGDGIPNQTEAMMPKLSAAALHTDPTPLWMTDTSYDNSLVRKFFRMPARFNKMSLPGETFERAKENEDGTITVTTYSFKQYAGWHKSPGGGEPDYFASFTPDCWNVAAGGAANWIASFEQNEGYDSDHDGLSDEEEKKARFRSATDPQDADSPRRRQAMYFQGPDRPSALQTMPRSAEAYPVCAKAYSEDMAFRTFTVECWAMPESLDDSVLVERAVWIGNENPGDLERMRKNFQLAIKGGKWYAKFDPFGTRDDDAVEVLSGFDAIADGWTHLAATYDGDTLRLYVNGVQVNYAKSGLLPAHGTEAVAVQLMGSNNPQSYWFDFENSYQAVIIGASAKTEAEGVRNGAALDVTRGLGWNRYARFYKGWIDEVRIWDGARTDAQIRDSMNERFTAEMAAANRQEFFDVWSTGVRRDTKDAEGNEPSMPAELRYHWSFDSVFGAQNENAVAISPLGFHDARALLSRPEGYEIAWWKQVLAGYADTVYCNPAWIVWIPSTVAHLPRFDGTTTDSMFWSKDFMGDSLGSYTFANSAEPFSLWTQFFYNGAMSSLWYQTTPERHFLVNASDASNGSSLGLSFEFTGRHLNRCGDDLLALGGAYARYLDNETGLWDGNGASVSWEITGSDSDGDGLPDWWEEYADENYRPDGMDPAEEIGWDTIVVKDGVEMTAGEAYLLDLLEGKYMGADGKIVEGSDAYSRINADDDKNGIPDWWEAKYDVVGQDIFADNDNDGLSNYAEYLAFADHGVVLDPTMSATDGHIHDYFRQITDDEDPMKGWYVGEAVSDHDFMENWLEDQYDSYYVNRHEYDAAFDRDRDGWSNFAEIRAGTDPTVAAILSIDATELSAYPTPVVEADVSLDTGASVEGTVVFQAWSSPTLQGNPDATWSISAGSGETASYTRLLGMNPGTVVNIQLGPGSVVPDSISIDFCDPTAHEYHYNVESNGTQTLRQVLVIGTGPWQDVYKDSSHSDDPSIGDIVNLGGDHSLGTINYKTGEMMIDLGAVQETMGLITSQTASEVVKIETVLPRSYVRVGWSSKMLSGSAVTHLYLVEPSEGHLREGKNTFVAFLDTDGNGSASEGEPLSVLRDVDIGWSRACGLAFELVSNHPAGPNFVHESSGSPELVRIFRTAINGMAGSGVRRLVFSRRLDFAGRQYLSRADYVRSGEFDLDWRNLISDAMNADIKPADVVSAEYEVYFGTNVLADATFTRTFPVARSAPVVVAPSESSGYLVRTARPVFAWAGSDGYTAFDIQVATTNEQGAYVNVWESGVKSLPAHGALGYEFSPEMYVGRELYDGSNYFWRVAQFNAKYPTDIRLADQDAVWSEWAEFRTAVDSMKLDTGYGRVKVDVRYFGPATDEPLTNVFVEVFSSPDFTGKLLASVRLGDTLGTETKTGSLAVTNDITVPFLSVCTNNAVVLDGIRVGTVYVRAFVDRNGNGRRDVWETWGYANGVGAVRAAIYAPAALTVSSKTTACAECVVFMEDTDVNQNLIPDSLEDISVLAASASQGGGDDDTDFDLDGRTASQEDDYGTDPTLWDTDGDGMPDGYEIDAGTDPLTPDGDEVVSGDVMAYFTTNMTVITFWDGVDDRSATNMYAVMDANVNVNVGDDASALTNSLCSVYDYAGKHGLGKPADFAVLEDCKVYAVVENAEVVLVHAQVYDAFGFDPTTANPVEFAAGTAVNTKEFTALDKYLVCRYLEQAYGLTDEKKMNIEKAWAQYTLKPGDADNNHNGIPDGWELYVMFGTDGTAATLADAKVSPFRTGTAGMEYVRNADNTPDGGGLSILNEYDGGNAPTDPWQIDTDGDGVLDRYAFQYSLKGGEADDDFDHDGLSNYAEYLITEVFKLAVCDPENPKTSDGIADAYRKVGDLYLGEIFADHDKVDDEWEGLYGTMTDGTTPCASRYAYDPSSDQDGDGWSNFAESMAETRPDMAGMQILDDGMVQEYPVPIVRVRASYAGDAKISAPIVVKAYLGAAEKKTADATWTVAGPGEGGAVDRELLLGFNKGREIVVGLGPGAVVQGTVNVYFRDPNEISVSEDGGVLINPPLNSEWRLGMIESTTGGDQLHTTLGAGSDMVMGEVDYANGLATIRLADVPQYLCHFDKGTWYYGEGIESNAYTLVDTSRAYVKIAWQNKSAADEQTLNFSLSNADSGRVREGKNTFVVFADEDANGKFDPGEPYGFAHDVDVGWSGANVEVELTRTSPVFARLNLYAGTDDRVTLYGEDSGDVVWHDPQGINSNDTPVATLTKAEHLRIVPYSVSGTIQDSANSDREFVELVNLVTNRVVAEFDVDSANKRVLTEADFIRDVKFDIDWDGFRSEILLNSRVGDAVGDVTAVKYRIVLGRDGSIGKESNYDEDSDPVRAYATLIERRFERTSSRTRPTELSTDELQYGARPTFCWRLDEPAGTSGYAASSARYGCSYTAFQLQVKDSSGAVVYDSGVRCAPPRNADGVFSWTAPLCAGDLTANNKVFAPAANWTWRVAMYNAKFKPSTRESSNGWSDAHAFSTAVGTQQEMGDNGYGQIDVAVRYAGPTKVLDKCAATTQSKGIVRVQAFDTPDFTGDPVAATIVTDVSVITNTMDISNTVALVGLKMGGTYYVRAFIDSDGNGVKDDWESWGCVNFLGEENVSNFNLPKGIALDASAVRAPVVGLFIDDADTDQDWMPDAWEYAEAGWTGDWNVVKNQRKASLGGKVAIDTTGFGDANLSTGLPGAPLTVFESGSFAQQLLGIPASTMTFNDIRAAIDASIHPTTVKITAMTLDSAAKQVVLTLDADVALSVAGRLVSQVYGIEPSGEATVTVMVYKKDTLLDAVWKPACDPITNVKIGANQSYVTIPLGDELDLNSGFYKVVVEPTP